MTKKKRLIWSAVISIGLLVVSYFVSNLPLSLTGETVLLKLLSSDKMKVVDSVWVADSVLFVDVSYDKVLVPYIDTVSIAIESKTFTYSFAKGQTPITDRHKLLKLLQFLDKKEKEENENDSMYYKYILLDILFSNKEKTEWDDTLFSTIASMPRIIIPYSEEEKLAEQVPKNKAYLAKYSYSIAEGGFTKYLYYKKTKKGVWEKTIPAAMFEKVTGRRIKKIGPIYIEGMHLAKRSNFLPLDVWPNRWYNLGMELFDDTLKVALSDSDTAYYYGKSYLYGSNSLTKGKYIVIGSNGNDDWHPTFKRKEMAGVAIVFNAFYSMKEGQYKIKWRFVVLLFALYFMITYSLVFGEWKERVFRVRWFERLKMGWKILFFFLLSLLSYGAVLTTFCLVVYVLFDRVFEIFIVSIVYSIMSLIVKFNKQVQLWQKK